MATYTADTAAEIAGHINGTGGYTRAANGDTVSIPAGSYTLAADLTPQAGVTIAGAGRATTILGGSATAGRWEAALAGSVNKLIVRDLTINAAAMNGKTLGAVTSIVNLANGSFDLRNVRITGGLVAGNGITFIADTHKCLGRMIDCLVDDPFDDCISTKAPGGAGVAATSLLQLHGCEAHSSGPDGSDQCLTGHDAFAIHDYFGYYHDANTNAVAQDASTTPLVLVGTKIRGGLVFAQFLDGVDYQGPGITLYGASTVRNSTLRFTTDVDGITTDVANAIIQNNEIVNAFGALSTGVAGVRILDDAANVSGNVLKSWTGVNKCGIRIDTAAAGTIYLLNNRTDGCTRGFQIDLGAAKTVVLKNNVCTGSVDYDVVQFGATGSITKGSNVFPGAFSGYTADASDTLVAAALGSDLTPTIDGNCDRTGDATVLANLPGLDFYRAPRTPDGRTVSRGPVERPRVVGRRIALPAYTEALLAP